MNITKTLDAKGLACPMPIVKTKKAMDTLNSGEVLEVHVTDKGALNDFPAWSKSGGHTIVEQTEEAGVLTSTFKKHKNKRVASNYSLFLRKKEYTMDLTFIISHFCTWFYWLIYFRNAWHWWINY